MHFFKKNINLFLVLIIPFIFLAIALYTLSDYGINWDEPYHFRRGQAFLQFFLTGKKTYDGLPKYRGLLGTSDTPGFRNSDQNFEDAQKNTESNSKGRRSFYQDDAWNGEFFIDVEKSNGHPALNGLLASTFNKIFYQKLGILGDIESYHLFIVLTVSLMSFFVAIFVWKQYGAIESIIASLALATYPLLLGEQHFNVKDPVEAAFFTLTIISAYLGIKKNNLKWLLLASVFFGVALSTKFNILFSLPILGIFLIFYLYKNRGDLNQKLKKNILITIFFLPIIALGILVMSFPTIWENPVFGIEQIIKFYMGVGFSTSQPAGYYVGFFNKFPLEWILYTTQPIVLGLILTSAFFLKSLIKKSDFVFLLAVWLIISIGRISFFGTTSYGGVRLIMEYIPALAMLAGVLGGYLAKLKNGKYLILVTILIIAGFFPTIFKLIKIHPNENVYFNVIVGGLKGAKDKNINSWGNSYGNAYYPGILWLNNNSEQGSKLTVPINLTVNIPRYKLRKDIALSDTYWSGSKHEGEYVIEMTHDSPTLEWFSLKYLNTVMSPVYEVKVDDVAIAKVWKNDRNHVKPEFAETNILKVGATGNLDKKQLTITLPKQEKIMQITVFQPTTDCSPVNTGYVQTSVDGKSWSREVEDIARDQLKQAKLRSTSATFDFHFVAKEAKTIIFETSNTNACLLKATSAEITTLRE